MPCWTVQTNEIKLHNPNLEMMTAAAKSLGFRVNSLEYSKRISQDYILTADRFTDKTSIVVTAAGEVRVTSAAGSTADLRAVSNSLNRGYSAEIIRTASKRFGWNVKAVSETKFQVKRRF